MGTPAASHRRTGRDKRSVGVGLAEGEPQEAGSITNGAPRPTSAADTRGLETSCRKSTFDLNATRTFRPQKRALPNCKRNSPRWSDNATMPNPALARRLAVLVTG